MELYKFDNEAMEVKETLIGLERLRSRRKIEPYFQPEASAEMLEDAKRHVTYDILEEIKKYISVKEINTHEVEAELCLPYIYDDAMKTKDREISHLQTEVSRERRRAFDYQNNINELLGRSLWQRILNNYPPKTNKRD